MIRGRSVGATMETGTHEDRSTGAEGRAQFPGGGDARCFPHHTDTMVWKKNM